MYKLLKAELSRRLTSLIFISEVIFILIYNFMIIMRTTYGFEIDTTYFLFDKSFVLCIFIATNVSLQISQELDARTINNKLFYGYSKSAFYKTEIIAGIMEGILLFLFDTISIIILCIIKNYETNLLGTRFIVNLVIALVIISTIAVISTVLSLLVNHRLISVFIVMTITLLLLNAGDNTVSILKEPEQTTRFNVEGVMEDNPLYVEGTERIAHNTHLLLSPYAQACYIDNMLHEEQAMKFNNSLIMRNTPYHIEFLLSNMIECLTLYFLGFYLFKKRNLQ